jgi:hypothetical protein
MHVVLLAAFCLAFFGLMRGVHLEKFSTNMLSEQDIAVHGLPQLTQPYHSVFGQGKTDVQL